MLKRGSIIVKGCSVVPLHRWEVHEFFWGTAVREQRTGKWYCIFLKPDAQQVNIEGLDVVLHENGIEFLPR